MSDNATGIRLAMEALEPNRRGRLERYRSVDAPIPKNSVELLQQVYKDPNEPLHTRMKAAVACLPFEFPKLAATYNLSGDNKDFATLLAERRLAKRKAAPVIDAVPVDRENLAGPMPRLQRRY